MNTIQKWKIAIYGITAFAGLTAFVEKVREKVFVPNQNKYQEYHAVTDSYGSFIWVKQLPPESFNCYLGPAYCTVRVIPGYVPTNGQLIPLGKLAERVYISSIYK